jgi:putative copper resistance protein D
VLTGASPPIELSVTEVLLALVRGAFVASVLSSFGATLFLSVLAPALLRRLEGSKAATRVVWCSLVAAFMAGLAWLVFETAVIVDAESFVQAVATVPLVLSETRFGQVLGLQALALAIAAAAMASRRPTGPMAAACLTGIACLLEAGHSHAFAMSHGPSALLLSQALHLLAAGAWLGGLLPLLLVMREVPLDLAALISRRFSTLGVVSVTILAATATFQGWVLAGGLRGFTGTAYGAVLLIKAALFAGLIALAAHNRFRLTPALARPDGELARRALVQNIAVDMVIGLCVVLAAGVLSSLEPGMHMLAAR